MAARYPEWLRRTGATTDNPAALNVGKKLLGYLSVRRQTPGVKTLAKRVVLDDGTAVEAAFHGDQPMVRVIPPGSQEACELYVESGMLDLGPNIAADAGNRFHRGSPEFDNSPATLHFGDGVDCPSGEPGLIGRVRLNVKAKSVESECLPRRGSSVESRLTDPAKKKAQAILPASCWSGLMQRYVQAVYGGVSLDYEVDGETLVVEGVNVGGYGQSVGLTEVAGTHVFVFAWSGAVQCARLEFKSPCGEAVYRAWKIFRNASFADKLLTIALSEAYPGDAVTVGDVGAMQHLSLYGWQFSPAAPEAHAVVVDDGDTVLKKLKVMPSGDSYTVSVTDVETKPMAPEAFPCIVRDPSGTLSTLASDDDPGLTFDKEYDHPICCFYEGPDLVVVRYRVQTPAQVIEMQPGWDCIDTSVGEPRAAGGSWPMDTVEDARNCGVMPLTQHGNRLVSGFNGTSRSKNRTYVNAGTYADKGGTVLWSTVRTCDVIADLLRTDDGTESGSEAGKTWFLQDGWNCLVRTYNLGEGFTRSANFTGIEDNNLFWDEILPSGGYAPPGSHLCTAPVAASDSYFPYPNPAYCNYRGPTIHGTSCTEWDRWPPNDTTGHTLDAEGTLSGSCVTQCAKAHMSAFYGEVVAGPKTYLAIPRGDCAAAVAVTINNQGAHLGEDLYAYGYAYFTSDYCNPIDVGDCTGTWRRECSGWDPVAAAYTHSPHSFLYAEYNALNLGFYQSMFTEPPAGLFLALDPHNASRPDNPSWKKQRLHADWLSVNASASVVFQTLHVEGEFEEVLDGTELPWGETENEVTCSFIHSIVWGGYTLDPIAVLRDDGETSVEQILLAAPSTLLHEGFSYVSRRSLLGARTAWSNVLDFGSSIGMDRESLTGGYAAVNTPSFVGWA